MSNFYNNRPATSEARTYVTINGVDMRTYGLELTDYKIGAPVPVTNYIDVPGRMGRLDVSDALNGYVSYSHREIEMTFHVRQTYTEWHSLISALSAAVDGVQSHVIFSKDPDWYYRGRFVIDFIKSNPVSGDVILSCRDAFPFKLKFFEETMTLENGGREVYTYRPIENGWKYISEITVDKTTTTHSSSGGDIADAVFCDTYMSIDSQIRNRSVTMKADEKEYYLYYGIGQVQAASVFGVTLQPFDADYVGTGHFKFEVGVF